MTSNRNQYFWMKPTVTLRCMAFAVASLAAWTALGQQVIPLQHRWEVEPGFGDVWSINREPRAKFLDIKDISSDLANVRFEAAQNICQNYDRPSFRNDPKVLELLIGQFDN
ncbi:MAG: hypothetical protein ACKO3V_15390, partial [Pirellula sp.]